MPPNRRALTREVTQRIARYGDPLVRQRTQTVVWQLHPVEVDEALDKSLLCRTRRDVVIHDTDQMRYDEVVALCRELEALTGYPVYRMWSGGARVALGGGEWYTLPAPWAEAIAREMGHAVVLGYHLLSYARDEAMRERVIALAKARGADPRADSHVRLPSAQYRPHEIDLAAEPPQHELGRRVLAEAKRRYRGQARHRRVIRDVGYRQWHAANWTAEKLAGLITWLRGLRCDQPWSPEPTAGWRPGSVRVPPDSALPVDDPRWGPLTTWYAIVGDDAALDEIARRRRPDIIRSSIDTIPAEAEQQVRAALDRGDMATAMGIAAKVGLNVPAVERTATRATGPRATTAPQTLSASLDELLARAVPPGQRSQHDLRICVHARAEGHTIEDIWQLVPTAPGLDGYRRRHDRKRGTTTPATRAWGRKRLEKDWKKAARAYVSRRARTIAHVLSMGLSEPALAVYLELARCDGGRRGAAVVRLSHGELAVETGLSLAAVNGGVHELIDSKVVRYAGPRARFGSRYAQEYILSDVVEPTNPEEKPEDEHMMSSPPTSVDVGLLMRGVALLRRAGVPLCWLAPADGGRRTVLSMLLDGRAGPDVLAGMGDLARRAAKEWTAAARVELEYRRQRYREILDRWEHAGRTTSDGRLVSLREVLQRAAERDDTYYVIRRAA